MPSQGRYYFKHFTYINSLSLKQLSAVGNFASHILEVKKLRHGELTSLAESHTPCKMAQLGFEHCSFRIHSFICLSAIEEVNNSLEKLLEIQTSVSTAYIVIMDDMFVYKFSIIRTGIQLWHKCLLVSTRSSVLILSNFLNS